MYTIRICFQIIASLNLPFDLVLLFVMQICILKMMVPIFITINVILTLRKSISPLYSLAFLKENFLINGVGKNASCDDDLNFSISFFSNLMDCLYAFIW